MKTIEIREKYNVAVAKLEKNETRIKSLFVKMQKLETEMRGNDFLGKEWAFYCKNDEAYKLEEKRFNNQMSLESAIDKREDNKKTVSNWKKRLVEAEYQEAVIRNLPQILKIMVIDLTDIWTKQDMENNAFILNDYAENKANYKNNYKKIMEAQMSEEDVRKDNQKTAQNFVIDLQNRAMAKAGYITSWENVRMSGHCLNGTVTGDKGTATIETIGAGGYNIQRYHLRAIVR